MIKIGTKNVEEVYIDNKPVSEIYIGKTLVYTASSKGLEFEYNSGLSGYSVLGIGSCTDTKLKIPKSYDDETNGKLPVNYVYTYAFSNKKDLVSVKIPNSVTRIGLGAFYKCSSIKNIKIPFIGATEDGTTDTHLGHIFGANTYGDNPSYVPTSLETVTITGGSSIGDYAFYRCSSLKNVIIPNSVTRIKTSAFEHCTSLTSIVIPDSVTSIGYYAFLGSGLTSIEIPNSVTFIGDEAFAYCYSLTSINFGGTMEQWKKAVENKNMNYSGKIVCSDGTING